MSEIKVLDKSIYNRIAAGEVVERPLSIVKELVENSIDAGASAISIDIEEGGLKRICVADNGKGIAPDDVPTAFLAHATSKIKQIDDLDSIATLGFRGEALPSISAVSVVKMNTRQQNASMGFTYTVDNGVVTDSAECGCPFGTKVTVTKLFDKIPARKKFLEKTSAEESAITTTVAKLILANYNVSFKYSLNGKVIYRSTGQSLEDAIYAVYGKEFFSGLLPVEYKNGDISLVGYACKPSASKHTKGFQTLVVNGRYVKNEDVGFWIYGCYMNYLMKRQYPAFVLHLNLPCDLVDVNVHPNKLEIKFANENLIKKIITDCIKEQILKTLLIPQTYNDAPTNNTENIIEEEYEIDGESTLFSAEKTAFDTTKTTFDSSILGEIRTERVKSNYVDPKSFFDKGVTFSSFEMLKSTVADISDPNQKNDQKTDKAFFEKLSSDIKQSDITFFEQSTQSKEDLSALENKDNIVQEEFLPSEQARFCGKIFNTYLIYECQNDAYVIDQHAAHERILFDKLVDAYNNSNVSVQQLLIPYTFSLSAEESNALSAMLNELDKFGFHFEKYDGFSFSLKSVPLECTEMDISDFLSTLIDNVTSKTITAKADILRDNLAQWACKAAVKGGMDIAQSKIDRLISDMLSRGRVLVCPHGRPIIIRLTKAQVEKMFKRIV